MHDPFAFIKEEEPDSETEQFSTDLIESIFDQSNLNPAILGSLVSTISLNEILEQEKKGIAFILSILDLPGDLGLELWGHNNGANFILDISAAPIPL